MVGISGFHFFQKYGIDGREGGYRRAYIGYIKLRTGEGEV